MMRLFFQMKKVSRALLANSHLTDGFMLEGCGYKPVSLYVDSLQKEMVKQIRKYVFHCLDSCIELKRLGSKC